MVAGIAPNHPAWISRQGPFPTPSEEAVLCILILRAWEIRAAEDSNVERVLSRPCPLPRTIAGWCLRFQVLVYFVLRTLRHSAHH